MTTMSTPRAGRFVGQSVQRKEDKRLLTGHGLYVDDVELPGMLHAAFLRSEVAKAAIISIDTGAAQALPGVEAIYTWQDFDGTFGEAWHAMLGEALQVPPPLAVGDVRHVGEPIALVVADSRYVAEDALELIDVQLDIGVPCIDFRTAAADTEHLVHGAWGFPSNAMVEVPFTPLSSDLDQAFADAKHVVECTIEQNRYLCVPMEGRGVVASWARGRDELDLVCATQSVHETRNFFARYLRIPEGSIRVTARDVGGGFGQKMFVFREECAVVLATRLLGRPVKWIEDRRENLVAASHSRNEAGTVRLAIDAAHVIQAITIDHVADVGAYPPCPAVIDVRLLPGPYKIPRLGFASKLVWTNTMGKAAYRGPWMFETTAREMAIDHAARTLGRRLGPGRTGRAPRGISRPCRAVRSSGPASTSIPCSCPSTTSWIRPARPSTPGVGSPPRSVLRYSLAGPWRRSWRRSWRPIRARGDRSGRGTARCPGRSGLAECRKVARLIKLRL